MPNILILMSNIHVGGGVQVAASFLYELKNFYKQSKRLSVFASSEVNVALDSLSTNKCFLNYKVINVYGFESNSNNLSFKIDHFDTVFTVFGPLYRWNTPFRSLVGFAQPWIIYPNNECYAMLPIFQRIKTRLKFWVQGHFFKRANVLIVELEHVKRGLIAALDIPAERIHVVHNCISSIYFDEKVWQPVDVPTQGEFLRLGFVGRNYMHKNTEIFTQTALILSQIYGIKALFYVTFTDKEWKECTPKFRDVCINIGPLSLTQCPRFYQALDGVVFPSLLECFSVTPLEAMVMEKPLIASDRPFNRDICGSHAHYFDPLSPASAAQTIARVFGGANCRLALRAAREHAISFSNPKERAEKYLNLLMCDLPTQ